MISFAAGGLVFVGLSFLTLPCVMLVIAMAIAHNDERPLARPPQMDHLDNDLHEFHAIIWDAENPAVDPEDLE